MTLTDDDFALVFTAIKDSLKHGDWSEAGRAQLEALRLRLKTFRQK